MKSKKKTPTFSKKGTPEIVGFMGIASIAARGLRKVYVWFQKRSGKKKKSVNAEKRVGSQVAAKQPKNPQQGIGGYEQSNKKNHVILQKKALLTG